MQKAIKEISNAPPQLPNMYLFIYTHLFGHTHTQRVAFVTHLPAHPLLAPKSDSKTFNTFAECKTISCSPDLSESFEASWHVHFTNMHVNHSQSNKNILSVKHVQGKYPNVRSAINSYIESSEREREKVLPLLPLQVPSWNAYNKFLKLRVSGSPYVTAVFLVCFSKNIYYKNLVFLPFPCIGKSKNQ